MFKIKINKRGAFSPQYIKQKEGKNMTTELNKERAKHIDEMLNELEYMRRVAFNNAVLSPEDIRYKSVSIYGIIVQNQATIRCLKNKYNGLIMARREVFTQVYNEIVDLYHESEKAFNEVVLTTSNRRKIKELISKAEKLRNTKIKEHGIVTISDTTEIIEILKEYNNTEVLTPYQKETLDIYKQAIDNKYKELGLDNPKEYE